MHRLMFLKLLILLAIPTSLEAATPALSIAAYTGRVSYQPGETVTLHVSTAAPVFRAEVRRHALVPEVVWSRDDVPGGEHPVPGDASSMGCRWPVAVEVPISSDWRSGYYRVFLQAGEAATECFFVLRAAAPGTASRVLIQLSTNTYNAYNNFGGFSLYAYNGLGGNQGHRVSFERPPASQFESWERPFVDWAERRGIPLEFAANSDLEFHPELLEKYRLVLSVGHDEYWSKPMRDHLEAFIGRGGNAAFFSGNTCCWQVRSEDGGKALTSWKQNYHSDPVYGARAGYQTLSSLWSHFLIERPENELTGVGFLWGGYHRSHGQLMDGSGAFTVHRPDHWLFDGTGLERGGSFGGKDSIVGYECDGCEIGWRDGLPFPTHRDGTPRTFEILATAPAQWHPDDCQWYDQWENGRKGNAVMGVYTRGGTVFTCGSTDWSHGLAGADPTVEKITHTIIERLSR